jgi:hypothetical protein
MFFNTSRTFSSWMMFTRSRFTNSSRQGRFWGWAGGAAAPGPKKSGAPPRQYVLCTCPYNAAPFFVLENRAFSIPWSQWRSRIEILKGHRGPFCSSLYVRDQESGFSQSGLRWYASRRRRLRQTPSSRLIAYVHRRHWFVRQSPRRHTLVQLEVLAHGDWFLEKVLGKLWDLSLSIDLNLLFSFMGSLCPNSYSTSDEKFLISC